MERIAIFPGSFDPFTIGHDSVVRRALPLFDKIIIGIGVNAEKRPLFLLLFHVWSAGDRAGPIIQHKKTADSGILFH